MHVSICDDDHTVLHTLEHLVMSFFQSRSISCTIECHSSPLQFLTASELTLPDIAFIDLMMDEMDGYEVAKRLRTASRDCEIIFATSFMHRMPEAFEYKPVAFIAKPVTKADVEEALGIILSYRWYDERSYLVRIRGEHQRIPTKTSNTLKVSDIKCLFI